MIASWITTDDWCCVNYCGVLAFCRCSNCWLIMKCCRNAGSYGGERSKNMGQGGERRMQTGSQKHGASHPEPIVDITPSGIDTSRAPGQCHAVVKKINVVPLRVLWVSTLYKWSILCLLLKCIVLFSDTVWFCLFDIVSSGDKNQSGSQQNRANSSLSNSLSSAVSYSDKTEHKEPVSKSARRFNYGSSSRQYQVLHLVVCRIIITELLLFYYTVPQSTVHWWSTFNPCLHLQALLHQNSASTALHYGLGDKPNCYLVFSVVHVYGLFVIYYIFNTYNLHMMDNSCYSLLLLFKTE